MVVHRRCGFVDAPIRLAPGRSQHGRRLVTENDVRRSCATTTLTTIMLPGIAINYAPLEQSRDRLLLDN